MNGAGFQKGLTCESCHSKYLPGVGLGGARLHASAIEEGSKRMGVGLASRFRQAYLLGPDAEMELQL